MEFEVVGVKLLRGAETVLDSIVDLWKTSEGVKPDYCDSISIRLEARESQWKNVFTINAVVPVGGNAPRIGDKFDFSPLPNTLMRMSQSLPQGKKFCDDVSCSLLSMSRPHQFGNGCRLWKDSQK